MSRRARTVVLLAAASVPGAALGLRDAAALVLSLPAVQATHVRSGGEEFGAYDLNFGAQAEVYASATCGAGGCFVDDIAMLQWDLGAIPPGAQILDVSLELQLLVFDAGGQDLILLSPDGGRGVPVNRKAWDEDTVSALSSEWVVEEILDLTLPFGWVFLWNGGTHVPGPGPSNTVPGPAGLTTYVISDTDASGGLSAAVALWLADPASNHGLSLTLEGSGEPGQEIVFASDETAHAPVLRVTLVPEPHPAALGAGALLAVLVGCARRLRGPRRSYRLRSSSRPGRSPG